MGFNDLQANYMSLVGGGSLLIGTIPAIFLMETCGRRFWAIAMLPGFFIGLVLVGVSYQLNQSAGLGVYLTGLIMYEMFFGSYACLTWVVSFASTLAPFRRIRRRSRTMWLLSLCCTTGCGLSFRRDFWGWNQVFRCSVKCFTISLTVTTATMSTRSMLQSQSEWPRA